MRTRVAGGTVVLLCGCVGLLHGQPDQPGAAATGRRIVAAIGIGKYQNAGVWRDIPPAEASARELQAVLVREFGYQAVEGSPLTGAATAASIDTYLGRLVDTLTVDDDLIFFYAGHGTTLPQGAEEAGYLVPYDAGVNPAASGLIEIGSLLKRLRESRARNVLVILDACETGVAVPRFGTSAAGSQYAGNSRIVITAAEAHQKASADGGSHGATLFTGALLDLLERGDCDISGGGYCTATEVGLLSRRRLSELKARQTPIFGSFGGDEAGDFRIWRFGEETVRWMAARACDATEKECLETSGIESFLRQYPAGIYATAARKELRDRVERAIRRTGTGVTSDLRLVAGDGPRQSVTWNEENAPADDRLVFMWVPDGKTPFWMSKYEVSVTQYSRFLRGASMPRAPSFNRGWKEHPDEPIVNVSWVQARQYCVALGGDLPTFDQWVRAAQYGQTPPERFPWNGDPKPGWANLAGWKEDRYLFAAPVREFPQGENALQIRNLIGNVSEWTSSAGEDPGKAIAAGWSFADTWERAGIAEGNEVELSGSNTVGFRCVVVPGSRQ